MKTLLRFMDWPLRAKMAALLVVASLLPLGVATLINIRQARQRILANTSALLAARGDELVCGLDTFHRGYQRSVDQVAHLPNVVEFYQARPEDSDRFKSSVRAVLEVWPASDPNIRGVAILDLSGTVKLATEDPLIGLDLSPHSYVREALRGVSVISDIHLAESQVGYAPTIAYLAPVFGTDRKVIGVAAFWVRASALWDVMKASNELAGPGSFAVLFDHQGIRIAHTYSEEMVFHPGGRLDPATISALVAEHRFGKRTRQLLEDVRAFPEQFDRALAESPDQGVFRGFAPVNQKWNYGVARRFETVPWTVFYMIPEQSLNAQITQMVREKATFAEVIILIALLAGTWFATVILKPIGFLSTATKLIAGGDLSARVQAGHADELGRLGTSFNSMAERIQAQAAALQRARDDLEVRIQERTGELVKTNKNLEAEIAERMHTEAILRENQERTRAVVDTALDGIITMDHEGRIVDFNPAAERIFGYRGSEVIGRALAEVIIPPALRERHRRGLAHWLATGKGPVLGQRVEQTALRADGTEFPIELSITRVGSAEPPVFTGFLRDITERNRAEEEVRKSQARFSAVFRSGPVAMSINTVADGRLIDANEQYCEFFGYSRAEIIGRSVLDLKIWANPEERAPVIQRLLKEGAIRGLEVKQRRRSGEVRDVLASLELIELAGERGPVLISMFTDITERKQAEEALRESGERLQLAQQVARVGTFEWNTQTGVNHWTPELEAMYGLPPGAFAGTQQTWENLVHPEDRAEAARQVSLAMESGNFEGEWRVVWPDGTVHWLAGRGFVFKDARGKPLRLIGVNIDITGRKRAEQEIHQLNAKLEQRVLERTAQLEAANAELRQSRAELNSLFESLPGLYLVLTPDLKIVAASDAYLKATMTTREGILGRNFFDVFSDNPRDPGATAVSNMRASIGRVIKNAASDTMAIQKHDVRRPDGVFEERYWSPINSPVLGGDRQIKYIVHRVEEVTEFVLRKSQPSGGTAELSARVQHMEAEIFHSSQKLQATNQQLEAANQELEAFSYSVSHDLRAPLRHVMGFVNLLQEDAGPSLSEKSLRLLTTISQSAKRMGNLIDDLLAFSQVGRSEMQKTEVNLDELVEETLGDFQTDTKERNIVWEIRPLPAVRADRNLLRLALVNLMSNAVKFTGTRAQARIEIGCAPGGDRETVIFIRDNGAGFDPRYAGKLFGVFQRLHSENEFEGTGIGLANVQRIIQRHGGRTWAEGAVDGGAIFYFSIPKQNGGITGQ